MESWKVEEFTSMSVVWCELVVLFWLYLNNLRMLSGFKSPNHIDRS